MSRKRRHQTAVIREETQRVVTQSTPPLRDGLYWPDGMPLPAAVHARCLPCPACRRVLTDARGRAAVCTGTTATLAYYRCRVCGHRWKLPRIIPKLEKP